MFERLKSTDIFAKIVAVVLEFVGRGQVGKHFNIVNNYAFLQNIFLLINVEK